jgi:hypothetical protein
VTGLQTQVQKGEELVRAREQALEERRRELATVYYVIGSRRQLETAGVVSARGGILGLGRTLTAVDPPDDAVFTPLDTDQQSILPLPAGRATVVSAQPRGSYEVRVVEGGQQLHILDVREFRKVKQVVIVIA